MFLLEPDSPGEVAHAANIVHITHGICHIQRLRIGWHRVTYSIDVQYLQLVERVHLCAVSADPLALVS